MQPQSENEFTNRLGGILLILGWLLAIALLGFLYHKLVYTAKEPKVLSAGTAIRLDIQQNRDLHFRLRGKINHQKVTFLLDTGATYISIPGKIAKKLNLSSHQAIHLQTANGTIRGYLTEISQLEIGPLQFTNIRAVLIPDMQHNELLLGMNVLKYFKIEQRDNTLSLIYENPTSEE